MLGDITAEHIGSALAQNSTLEALDVGGSSCIGEEGAHYIANALENNTTLKRLFIDGILSNLKKSYFHSWI